MDRTTHDDGYAPDEHAIEELAEAFPDVDGAAAARELAEAEGAVARSAATPEQQDGVAAARDLRRPEERADAWRAATADG
ncbi:hypothetical protein [Pseudonocardia sp. 73-21]|uniref:hypothetical protein n=1 Tax=Pseudonocardia sp. 73-21 TaxID=1895809 RepID=UPI0009620500|nr:hypothetical protein [Pseudonocardia sp. 73-21]OJY48158.1 MAG: hypothetical protein BGP03_10920 [Pseudonocardia sp. 73-21]